MAGSLRRARAVSAALVGTLVVGLLSVIGSSVAPEPAFASTPSAQCTTTTGSAQGGLEVYPSHGKVFYIDSGQNQNVDAAYVGYQVKNVSGSTKANLWAKVDSFTGGVVGLANAQDAVYRVGDVANAATQPAFFLLQAGTSTTRAQGHVLRVYNGDPRLSGATELYSCTYNFVAVKETIKAAANKVTAVSSTSAQRLGGNLVVTVKGQTGTIGSGTSSPDGEVLWFTPAARSSWPSASLVLKQTSISFATNKLPDEGGAQNVSTHVNTLVFNNPRTNLAGANSRYYYVATYTFSIAGPVPASIGAVPIAQISSGTQIKHTDVSGITALPGSTLSVSTPVTVGVEKTVSSTIDTSGSDRLLSYTVTLTNSASEAVTLDQVVDDPSAGLTFKANSARYNSAAISDPAADSSGNLVFQGPFTVAANASRTLTYQMVSTCTTGSFSYANSAYATIGTVVVGQNASTLSGVNVSGSCPPTTGTVTVANQTIPPAAITQPASSVATTSASINGSVDPNGVSGQTITFQWGTSSSLTGATTVTLTNSTTATDFYAVTTNLTGLSSGTRYYYKVTIGSVSGEILSFTTTEVVGTPAVTTDSVTAIVQGTGSDGTAVFNGTIDPNQVSTTPSFVWGLSGNAGADANCTAASYTLSGTVMEDTDDNGSLDANVVLTGAFPSQFSLDATGLSQGKYYCVKARGTYSTSTIEGSPVLFRTQVLSTQTITFPTPSMSTPGSTATLGATTTSPLTVEYSSNTPDVCTVSGNVVTYLSGGICSLTASQPGDTSFYAADPVTVSFTVPTYTLTYNVNGGNSSAPVDGLSPYVKGASVTVSATTPTHASLFFAGWNTQAGGGGTSYASSAVFTIDANTDLYAQWSASTTYTLTYDNNGGTGGPGAAVHGAGSITLSSTAPTRDGYRFIGWNTQAGGGGTSYASSAAFTMPSSATTLYAQWVQVFTLTYDGNGATSGSVPGVTTHDSGAGPTLSGNSGTLARTGYTFDGWTTTANVGSAVTTVTLSGNQTVYARWVATVTYNANGATGGVPTDGTNYLPGATITISGNSGPLARTGFVFGGWNTLANGTGTTYQPGATPTNSGALVLYALWLDEVTLTFDGNGHTGGSVPSSQTHGRGQTVTVPSNSGSLVRTGYTFAGWSLSSTGGTTLTPGSGTVTLTANTTPVYAKWDVVVSGGGGGGGGGGAQPTPVVQPTVTPVPPRIPPSRIIPVTPPNPQANTTPKTPTPSPTVTPPPPPSLPGLRGFFEPPASGGGSGAEGPGSAFSGQSTIDLGVPAQSNAGGAQDPQAPEVNSNSVGRRTVDELAQESLGGFQPGATTYIEILGARTAARFVVSDVSEIDSFTLSRAIEASMPTQSADFFALDSVQPVNQPTVPRAWTPDERGGVAEFFAAVGLATPRSLADLNLEDYSQWLLVSANSSTYAPGTQVYLTLTSEPLVLASAVVGQDGTVSISGTLPVEFLTVGEHRVRLVGIRALEGVSVDGEGEIQLTPELVREIERFDLGTQATIAVVGANEQGATHVAMRVIPLVPIAPWWTLWFILVGALIALALRLTAVRTTRIRRVSTVVIGVVALLPAVILGWLSTVTVVVWWGLGIGLASVVLSALGPYRKAREDEPAGSRRS